MTVPLFDRPLSFAERAGCALPVVGDGLGLFVFGVALGGSGKMESGSRERHSARHVGVLGTRCWRRLGARGIGLVSSSSVQHSGPTPCAPYFGSTSARNARSRHVTPLLLQREPDAGFAWPSQGSYGRHSRSVHDRPGRNDSPVNSARATPQALSLNCRQLLHELAAELARIVGLSALAAGSRKSFPFRPLADWWGLTDERCRLFYERFVGLGLNPRDDRRPRLDDRSTPLQESISGGALALRQLIQPSSK